ncbi:hypothetical protein HNQ79_005068 [Streptomyces candidus]|uniref:Uncharacterized protein n=1 Tax=Streptomyces candidus TaxID=67283 RepID=A0A7X0LT18_9ACTN|nr:hypothetical protein [Streptomyces candidus]
MVEKGDVIAVTGKTHPRGGGMRRTRLTDKQEGAQGR